jgi:hypothetical protein
MRNFFRQVWVVAPRLGLEDGLRGRYRPAIGFPVHEGGRPAYQHAAQVRRCDGRAVVKVDWEMTMARYFGFGWADQLF